MRLASRPLLTLAVLLACVGSAFGQGSRFDSTAQKQVQNFLAPIPAAQITVCSSAGTGTPCSPITPIYTDAGLTQQIPGSTFPADSNGNFGFWAAPGTYKYSITATGVTGQLYTIVLPINAASNDTFTGSKTFTQQIVSTVTTGTAPFSIASTTQVTNLNASQLGGLTPPASAIVGINDTQNLTNKTLTVASSGNNVILLCSSGPSVAITGNSGVQNIFSCGISGNTVANLRGMRVTAVWSHSSGTATVTYGMTLNGVALWPSNNTASTVGGISQSALIIETTSTAGNVLTPQGFFFPDSEQLDRAGLDVKPNFGGYL